MTVKCKCPLGDLIWKIKLFLLKVVFQCTKINLPEYEETLSAISRLVIGTSRTIGSAKKFVRITSGFGGGE
jgi:hypothetical protein